MTGHRVGPRPAEATDGPRAPKDRRAPPAVAPLPPAIRGFWARHDGSVRVVAAAALLWGTAYLVWRIGWSGRGVAPAPYLALLAAELFGFLSLALFVWLGWRIPAVRRPPVTQARSVDVLVTTYDEPARVLEATLAGCAALRHPHTTWVLDDGRRPEIERLAARLGARYLTRPDNAHAKAGNINHALGVVDAELLLVLDADHVPMPDLLDAVVGYFDDPTVALVQTPHDFSNRDSFQHSRQARHEQTLFYEVICPGKDRHGAAFWCGSATVLRRAALDDVGGVRTDTVAEDFHTTLALHARGWRTRYHRETLVQGLAPHDLGGFLLQRDRWARGNLRVFRTEESPLRAPRLSLAQRASYLASLLNYGAGPQRLLLLLVLVSTLLTGALPLHASLETLALLWLPWSLLAFTATIALGRGTLGPLDSTVYGLSTMGIFTRAWGALVGPASNRFRVTPKEGVDTGGRPVLAMLREVTVLGAAILVAAVLRVLAVAGVVPLPRLAGLALAITLALALWELYCVGRTLVPAMQRRQVRSQFRTPTEVRARISGSRAVVPVLDLTTDGVAFRSPLAWDEGDRLVLLTRLPDVDGHLVDVVLPVEVRTSIAVGDGYRIGGRLGALDPLTRAALVDWVFVVAPATRLADDLLRSAGRESRVAGSTTERSRTAAARDGVARTA